MKRTLATLLALAMLLACFVPSAVADDDWITLRVECFDRSVTGLNIEDNMQLDYIQENFGDPNHIKVEFVPVSRWEETTILNTQLAGGTAPDLCITYDAGLTQQYIGMGGVYPLDDLLAEYGQNLTAFLGEDVLEYGRNTIYNDDGTPALDEDGNAKFIQYYLPARRISVAKLGCFIRGDWLEKLNMEEPTTIDAWVEYLRAAKEAKLGGEQTVPYVMKLYPNDPLFSTSIIMDAYLDFSQITEEMWFSQYHEQMPGAKEGYRLLNQLYNEGLISESFAIDNGDIRDRDMIQGYGGFYIEGPTQVWGDNYLEMERNVEGSYWIPVNPFQNAKGYHLHENYAANGLCIFIPSWVSEDVAVAAIKYLDWMADPENMYGNMYFLSHGVEGVNYEKKNEDGLPVGKKTNDDVSDEYKLIGAVDICFISNGSAFGSDELNNAFQALSFPGYEERVARSYEYSLTDSYPPVGYSVTIQAEADYGQMVLAKRAEFLTKVLTCSPDDFDAVYDACVQDTLSVGGDKIVAERLEAYRNGEIRGVYPPDVLDLK